MKINDKYNDWKKNEYREISSMIQTQLNDLQSPENCEKAKKINM